MNDDSPEQSEQSFHSPLQDTTPSGDEPTANPSQRKKIRLLSFVMGGLLIALFIHLINLAIINPVVPLSSKTIRPVALDGDFMDFVFTSRGQVELDTTANIIQVNLAIYHDTERIYHTNLMHVSHGEMDASRHFRADLLWAVTDHMHYPNGGIQIMLREEGVRSSSAWTDMNTVTIPGASTNFGTLSGETPLQLGEPMPIHAWTLGHITGYHTDPYGQLWPMRQTSVATFNEPARIFEPEQLGRNAQTIILYVLVN